MPSAMAFRSCINCAGEWGAPSDASGAGEEMAGPGIIPGPVAPAERTYGYRDYFGELLLLLLHESFFTVFNR